MAEQSQYPQGGGGQRSPWLYVVLTLLAVAVVGLVAYLFLRPSGDDQAAPTTSPSTSATPTATSPSPSPSSPSPTSTVDLSEFSTDPVIENGFPELGDPIGYGTAVRVGTHEGYDRVTFEFSGSGTPSYRVEYTDQPLSQGSGDPVDIAGDTVLQVTVTSVGYPDASATEPTTPSTEGTVFAQVKGIWGGFEGYGETFIGINGGPRPFHVQVLQDPLRLVVDVANG